MTEPQIYTCYMCDIPVSKRSEHVPPDCIFPEQKDTDGIDFKKNLIKIPSCEDHNLKKSKDDEFCMILMNLADSANEVAEHQRETKILRIDARKPYLIGSLIRETRLMLRRRESGLFEFKGIGRADFGRFKEEIEKICRGLFYFESGFTEKLAGKLYVYPNFLHKDWQANSEDDENTKLIHMIGDLHFNDLNDKGENPKVFRYQIIHENGYTVIRLVFFENLKILVFDESFYQQYKERLKLKEVMAAYAKDALKTAKAIITDKGHLTSMGFMFDIQTNRLTMFPNDAGLNEKDFIERFNVNLNEKEPDFAFIVLERMSPDQKIECIALDSRSYLGDGFILITPIIRKGDKVSFGKTVIRKHSTSKITEIERRSR
ncbi:hypothetical protein LLG95_09225 [bacterium]|nr:hypothetical protein [bacterium]